MKNISRFFVISILIALLPVKVSATQYQDVIYKIDGSILKGTLIEQDFQLERYKIQLEGGSVFVVEQKDISKITKEPKSATNAQSLQDAPPIPAETPKPQIVAPISAEYQGPIKATNSFFIGAFSHTRSQPWGEYYSSAYSLEEKFRGTQLGFHHTLSKNLAMVYTLEKAKLKEIIVRDDDRDEDVYEFTPTEDVDFLGKKVSIILSTNQHKNWRFFIGGGIYHNDYEGEYSSEKLYGSRFDLGMGYSWTNIQFTMRAAGDLTNNEDEIDYDLFDFSMAIGFNF